LPGPWLVVPAIRVAGADAQTDSTGRNACRPEWNPTESRHWSLAMKSFARTAKSLALSLLLAGSLLSATAFAAETVNINTADAATLDRVLLNIGPAKAEAIVAYRKANGAFRSAEQLALVKGVGLKTIEKNRDRIVVAGGAPARKAGAAAAATRPAAPRAANKR